jgi:hypothetical protein
VEQKRLCRKCDQCTRGKWLGGRKQIGERVTFNNENTEWLLAVFSIALLLGVVALSLHLSAPLSFRRLVVRARGKC